MEKQHSLNVQSSSVPPLFAHVCFRSAFLSDVSNPQTPNDLISALCIPNSPPHQHTTAVQLILSLHWFCYYFCVCCSLLCFNDLLLPAHNLLEVISSEVDRITGALFSTFDRLAPIKEIGSWSRDLERRVCSLFAQSVCSIGYAPLPPFLDSEDENYSQYADIYMYIYISLYMYI